MNDAVNSRASVEVFEKEFRKAKFLADGALAQIDESTLHAQLSPQQNSIAAIMQHLAGNMASRFTDFLSTDGEKFNRDREEEFVDKHLPRAELMALWEGGWQCLFGSLATVHDVDLTRIVTIRNEPHTVLQALVRQVGHYGWHAGQIALLAKHFRGDEWQYLTIPPGGTEAFNRKMGMK
jgi:Protein of unknown function (DUF1572)